LSSGMSAILTELERTKVCGDPILSLLPFTPDSQKLSLHLTDCSVSSLIAMSTTPKAPYPQKNLSQDLKGFDQPSWKKAPPFTNSISGPLSRYPSSSPENPSQGGTVLGKRFNPEESNSDSSNKSARKTGSGLVDYFARRQASSDKVQK